MKVCNKCGQAMTVLFQVDFYCPTCENAPKDPWDIQFKLVNDCSHPSEHSYVIDTHVFCRACGDHLRNLP